MKIGIFTMIACFLLQAPVFAQTVKFESYMLGDKIGHLTATRKAGGNIVYYEITSRSEAKVLGIKRVVETTSTMTFKDGMLIEGYYKSVDNGEVDNLRTIRWDGSKYVVDAGKEKTSFTEKVYASNVGMYFAEPKSASRIFYITSSDFTTVSIGKSGHEYTFKTSDGVKHRFIYENGVLKEVQNEVSLFTVTFKRIS